MIMDVSVCNISNKLAERLSKFRFNKSTTTNALILKIDREKMELIVEEDLRDCDIDTIRDALPLSQPRFVIISYELKYNDGRVSYPICLIYYSPPCTSPEVQMLYAGSANKLASECHLFKSATVQDVDELTQNFLKEKFS